MPRLRDLEAHFTKYATREPNAEERALNPQYGADWRIKTYGRVPTLAEADGVWFLCPKCFVANGGAVGTHSVAIGFEGRCPPGSYSQDHTGRDTRWNVSGTGIDDLVLTPSIDLSKHGAAEVRIVGGCEWHGWVGCGSAYPGEAV